MEIKKKALYKILGIFVIVLGFVLLLIFTGNNENSNGDFSVFEDSSLFPSIGPSNAKHTVVEFSDFQCPHCAIAAGVAPWTSGYSSLPHYNSAKNVKELANSGEIRFIYISMSFLGVESKYAAEAGLCANKQGKFWDMYEEIYGASTGPEENTGKYSKANLKILAQNIPDLDINQFNNCLDNDETLNDVQKITNIAKQFAESTPTFYIDGNKVSSSWSEISALLN